LPVGQVVDPLATGSLQSAERKGSERGTSSLLIDSTPTKPNDKRREWSSPPRTTRCTSVSELGAFEALGVAVRSALRTPPVARGDGA